MGKPLLALNAPVCITTYDAISAVADYQTQQHLQKNTQITPSKHYKYRIYNSRLQTNAGGYCM